jgi:small basic protein
MSYLERSIYLALKTQQYLNVIVKVGDILANDISLASIFVLGLAIFA